MDRLGEPIKKLDARTNYSSLNDEDPHSTDDIMGIFFLSTFVLNLDCRKGTNFYTN